MSARQQSAVRGSRRTAASSSGTGGSPGPRDARQVGGADHGAVDPRHRRGCRRPPRPPAGDSIMAITRCRSSRRRVVLGRGHGAEPAGPGVGGEAAVPQRRIVHRARPAPRPSAATSMCGATMPCAPWSRARSASRSRPHPTRTSTRHPCARRPARCAGAGRAGRPGRARSRSARSRSRPTATISTSLLARHPQQHPEQPVARFGPRPQPGTSGRSRDHPGGQVDVGAAQPGHGQHGHHRARPPRPR